MSRILSLFAALVLLTHSALAAPPPGDFADMAEALLPTVVNISTTAKISAEGQQALPQLPQLPQGSPFEDFFKEFYDQFKNMQPQGDRKVSSLGSGFIIDAAKGYVVTNNHVIKDADEIKVILHDDTTLDAQLVGTDEKTDIAVLKVAPKPGMTAARWGNSDNARVGSWVVAIGNPFGLGGTVTAGIVSARQRNINAGPYDDFIQTDASINRGNSGGPMFNAAGEVIGVNTAIFSPSGGSVGIGFAAPSNIVRTVVDQLVKYGQTRRGWLGVRIQDVTPDIAESLGLTSPDGALVSDVIKGSPADKAGLKNGDVILSYNGTKVDAVRRLPRLVAESEVGKKADIVYLRAGKQQKTAVTLGQLEKAEEKGLTGAPATASGKPGRGIEIKPLGLTLAALNDALRKAYSLPDTANGVVVTAIDPAGSAAEKGIAAGDVISEVDQQEITTPEQVLARVEAAKKSGRASLLLFVGRGEDRRFVALKIKK